MDKVYVNVHVSTLCVCVSVAALTGGELRRLLNCAVVLSFDPLSAVLVSPLHGCEVQTQGLLF